MKRKLSIFKNLSLFFLLILGTFFCIKNTYALLSEEDNIETKEKSIVDAPTFDSYSDIINENNIGKVWTDKTVFNNDIIIDDHTIKKDDDEDFLVSLSAMSLGIDLNIKEGNVKDIVILQDTSESMIEKTIKSGSGSIQRLQASKNSINKLLKIISDVNDSLSSEDEKFHVSLLTFNAIDNQNVIFNLTEINKENLESLQNKVNSMGTKSGTYVNPGLVKSLEQIETNGRKNVDSAIITFLDGEAKDDDAAIATANKIKNEHKVVMYSIIVNDGANGGTSTDLDRIGQGISSNYDNATNKANLGNKTGNTYYYIPKTEETLFESFRNVIKSIISKPYVFRKGSNLVFTDQLGEYMEVNKIKALVYNKAIYTKVEENTNNNVTTYVFSDSVTDFFGNSSDINNIKINVIKNEKIEEGDIVTVSIPFNLVPMAIYDVASTFLTDSTVYTTKLENASPVRIIYSSNIKKDVFELYKKNDSSIKEYIVNNGEIINYKALSKFYSNTFSKEVNNGTTTVTFSPHNKNSYYYYEDDLYLYIKNDTGYTLYTKDILENDTYYTKKIIYMIGDNKKAFETYEIVKATKDAIKDDNNHWYIKDRTKKIAVNASAKINNETETAINLNSTNWNDDSIKNYLGNNGVKTVEMDVDRISIKIDKIWEDDNNKNNKRPTSIIVRLKRNGEDLGEEYKAVLTEENNWMYTYENLPLVIDGEEVNYTIVEEEVNDYETKITGNQEIGFTITNTIIEFENPNTGFKIALTISGLSLMIIFTYRYLNKHKYTMYKL